MDARPDQKLRESFCGRGTTRLIAAAAVFALIACQTPIVHAEPPRLELIEATKIWDAAPHSAFTDLVRWRDAWYCGFREGNGHAGDRGFVRILKSSDGKQWSANAKIEHDKFDIRDAALSVTPDDRLMVVVGSQHSVDGERSTGTLVAFSSDQGGFTQPERIFPQGRWLWRVTWHDGVGYGVAYSAYADYPYASLETTENGVDYRPLVPRLFPEEIGWATEARIRFSEDGTAYCLHRVDRPKALSLLGHAQPPYTEWTWHAPVQRVGGPNFIQLPTGQWVGCGRLSGADGSHTEVFHLDMQSGSLKPLLRLPSGGDTSYPGMVWHDGQLWISYYSSHEGKTSIYLARLKNLSS